MARYKVTFFVDAARITTVQKEAEAAFPGCLVQKVDLAKSRAARLAEVADSVQGAMQDVEELRDELQEWFDNLPENFQTGDKGNELEDAITGLDEIKDALEGVDFDGVSFPTMMS